MSIEKMLRAKSIAVVGATDKPGSYGNFASVNALQSANGIKTYLVNRHGRNLFDQKSYFSLNDLPEVPDCIIICTPKNTVPDLLREAGELGVSGAIIIAAGYSEDGTPEGKAEEDKLRKIISNYDMSVMGPNCVGFVNNIDKFKLWGMAGTDFDLKSRKTGVACFANSGTMGIHSIATPYLSISYSFSMGNCAFLTMEEVLEYVLEQDDVHVIGMYLEGSRDPKRLLKCLERAAELEKPVVIHAAGMSAKGAESAASHTGNMASSRTVYDALFDKYGVILAENTDEYLCALNTLSVLKGELPEEAGFAAINSSGGENTVCADMCDKYGVPLPDLQPETVVKLRDILPVFATPSNPLDITSTTSAADELYLSVYETFASDPNIHGIIVTNDFAMPDEKALEMARVFGESMSERFARPIINFRKGKKALPVVVVPSLENLRDPEWRAKLAEYNVPILANSNVGYTVLGRICKYIKWKKQKHTLDNAVPDSSHAGKAIALTEYESKKLMKNAGLPVAKSFLVVSKEELREVLKDISMPLAMKISSPQIVHKTDAGGVRLNIKTDEEACEAFDGIMASCKAYNSEAELEGVLVEEMLKPGVEMLLGVVRDVKFGPMLMVGTGGTFAEVWEDVCLYPCPLGHEEAVRMIQALKGYKILKGYRGSPACDINALADTMVTLSDYAVENSESLKELDLNPVFVYENGKGCSVADAVVINYID